MHSCLTYNTQPISYFKYPAVTGRNLDTAAPASGRNSDVGFAQFWEPRDEIWQLLPFFLRTRLSFRYRMLPYCFPDHCCSRFNFQIEGPNIESCY